jgi:hypothetical protein
MRCISCNANLNDFESTRKYESGGFVDLCNHCFNASDMRDIGIIERQDLAYSEDVSSEVEVDDMEEL